MIAEPFADVIFCEYRIMRYVILLRRTGVNLSVFGCNALDSFIQL